MFARVGMLARGSKSIVTMVMGLLPSVNAMAQQQGVVANPPATGGTSLSYAEWAVPLTPEDNLGYLTVCFDAESPPSWQFIEDMMSALDQAGVLIPGDDGAADYFLSTRWSGAQGSPRHLTWSFVPDGLTISNGIGEGAKPSNLFATMDSKFATQGGRATWVARFQSCFDRWAAISGLTYTRIKGATVDWDDGASWGSSGSSTRGDVRIASKVLDGGGGVLAYNFFPSNGDMVLDSSENWGSSTNMHRFLRNTVMHEHGHGVGIQHVCSNNAAFLMEPFLSTSFDGPRHDDIRAVHRHYGDPQEIDDTAAAAKDLGTLAPGTYAALCTLPLPLTGTNPASSSNCSIDANGEMDHWRFVPSKPSVLSATVSPQGFTYNNNQQSSSGSCPTTSSINSLTIANLALRLLASDGVTILATAASAPTGQPESLAGLVLQAGSAYYLRVYESDSPTQSQLYTLSLTLTEQVGGSGCPGDVDGDGVVDQADLGILLAAFGCSGAPEGCDGDLDGDGDTDQADLGELLARYGTGCP